jgi:tetratricopeptide (TPR) repeat protein
MKKGVGVIAFVFTAAAAFAQRPDVHVINGNKLYREKKFDKALPEYQKAMADGATEGVVAYNLGNAYFRNLQFDEAAKTFDNTITGNTAVELKQKGYYNKGVSLSKQNKLEESIEAYKMAVKMNPADSDARVNLQKALLELKKKMPPTPEKKDEKKKKQPQQQQQQNSESKMSKKEVEQKLKALQEREQQVQRKMQQHNRVAGQQEKDW